MNHKSRTSQAGFSLVELMVVVAIIGVLASIAVPAVNKYIAKARQSEAKTNLSSLYTSEKAFYAEYTTFDTRFAAVGYSPEGQLRYNVGFGAQSATLAGGGNGFNTNVTNTNFNTVGYCGSAGTMSNGCTILNGANGATNGLTLPTSSTSTPTSFTASAAAIIHSSIAGGDFWTMTDTKVLSNATNGIP